MKDITIYWLLLKEKTKYKMCLTTFCRALEKHGWKEQMPTPNSWIFFRPGQLLTIYF